MKIQTKALLKSCSIDGTAIELSKSQYIELEFSAIDTGGGFRDAILDFSICFHKHNGVDSQMVGKQCDIVVTMQMPDNRKREATFSYNTEPAFNDKDELEVSGRLKEEKISREITGFMLHLLR